MCNLEALVRGGSGIGASRVRYRIAVHYRSGHERADEVAEPVGDEVDEPLRRGSHFLASPLIGIDLARNEEEIVVRS